ncbi:NADH:ubiquinone oxidoreductase subunit 3 (subunit A) [Aeromicrobium panaciterrae]|uniref:NADH:ubiquinone oxidoreductase subunit 3 (Subunit A) n=1 Tax=Aeromicrobium panaciterrae TaxID=363861 RepID=A0ABU1UJU6_9ACTN|nr:hypothetical protein [Aeromicrobium panaciterrae]MDR7085446.1 NADH:ubiquinone oxidoreductase subunit 3 (subunit A) [Aeromicrobium panaciterrae]
MSRTPKGGRRRLDSSVPPVYDVPTREPRIESARTLRLVMALVFLAWVGGTVGAGTAVVAVDSPTWVERPSAALLMVVFTIGLTHRGGGFMRIWLPLVTLLGVLAVVLETNMLLAASAAVTAILAAVWAVLVTRPAPSAIASTREYTVTLMVALSGTLAVAAWNAPVNYQRFNLAVLIVALGLVITLVWNLGAGLHGLGRQHFLILAGIAAVVVLVLVYSSLVRSNGSQSLVRAIDDAVIWMRTHINGVPRPVEVFVGFPALIVGVSLRAKRREGWWVQVFAVIGTGVMTTSLVTPGAFPTYIGLSTLYSAILGLIVGLIIRHQVVQERSARAARAIEDIVRVEPPRFAPLK